MRSLRHPNVVWVYGMVLPDVETRDCDGSGDDSPDESDRPSSMQVLCCRARSMWLRVASSPLIAARSLLTSDVLSHLVPSPQGAPGTVRPPAIVTEYMSGGSLRSALSRKADFVQGMLPRVMISFDAAKVR